MEAEVIEPAEFVVIPKDGALALTVPENRRLAFFTTTGAVDPVLDAIRKEIDGFSADVGTAKGRKEIASMAHKISQSKSYLETVGKDLAAAQKEIPKKIDAARKQIRDTLDKWRDEVRAPLTAWEEVEANRVADHKQAIERLRHAGWEPGDCSSSLLREALADVETIEISQKACEEFIADYAAEKDLALIRLTDAIARADKREADRAELDRLRKAEAARQEQERLDKIARDAADKATQEAEEKARQERKAADRAAQAERTAAAAREEQLRKDKEDAEQRAKEAEDNAKRAAEEAAAKAKRDAEEARRREEEEAREREANRKHRASINNVAVAALITGGVPEDAAKLAVTLIAKRMIPNIQINY
ncbi:MAG: hypothetical protein KGZ68_04485 [Dechloromonas sp.]|nr:hypothetical protein [Dechloromonas sp.]